MKNDIDDILLKLQSIVDDEKNLLYVCDKEHCKILLNYIEKLNIIINELATICYTYVPYPDCKEIFQDKIENLKKYEEIEKNNE